MLVMTEVGVISGVSTATGATSASTGVAISSSGCVLGSGSAGVSLAAAVGAWAIRATA
jgi:hypothetical protein